jgi:3-phytase
VGAGAGEAYGICLYRQGQDLFGFSILKDGTIHQIKLDVSGPTPISSIVRTYKLNTQSEGCVVDETTNRLYVAEEDVGLWRFDLSAPANAAPKLVQGADGKALVADAEGVALADEGEGKGYIIVSSQGDNAYTVFRRSDETYVGRFRIEAGEFGATEETDGIELITGNFGPRAPEGLFIAQDGDNAAGAQNFKLVSWATIKDALGIKE